MEAEEASRDPSPKYEANKPRKVRFKLNSSYSGRVLKHVYEDGQELDSPEETYPHSFMHNKIPRHLDVGQLGSFGDVPEQSGGGLYAQRINVYRGVPGLRPAALADLPDADPNATVLDFGKIIIYTSNLRIIPAPRRRETSIAKPSETIRDEPEQEERGRSGKRGEGRGGVKEERKEGERRGRSRRREGEGKGGGEEASKSHSHRSRGKHKSKSGRTHKDATPPKHKQQQQPEPVGCEQCGGSGCAPCSLCHGSKLSMLAIRFNESIRDLRCPACYPEGLGKCQSCAQ